jgi:serine/threonine-protein kinase
MNDFLDQFSNKHYKTNSSTANSDSIINGIAFSQDSSQNQSAKITSPVHDEDIDADYHRARIIKISIISVAIIVITAVVSVAAYILSLVTVMNFTNTLLSDAKTWALTNKVSIEVETAFSNEFDNGYVISQNKEAGQRIRKGSVLILYVSKGPDPDERITLPDFAIMDSMQISTWKETNKALNVNIMHEFSASIGTSQFIRLEFVNSSVNEANYTRKDSLLIFMSKGPYEKNIKVPDFVNKLKSESIAWAKQYSIELIYEEQASEKYPKDTILSQSIEPGVQISQGEEMTLLVSLGKAIVIPDFKKISMNEAAAITEFVVVMKTQYHASVPFGGLISQSLPLGQKFYDEMPRIVVTYSEGKPYIDDLKGKTEKDLQAYFYEFSSKGAEISYKVSYVDSPEPKGQVVNSEPHSQFVGMKQTVVVHVSKGNL